MNTLTFITRQSGTTYYAISPTIQEQLELEDMNAAMTQDHDDDWLRATNYPLFTRIESAIKAKLGNVVVSGKVINDQLTIIATGV